jgi:hypothetical protein
MTYQEFRRHLGKAGLSVNEFAALVQVLPNSVSNYSKKPEVPRGYALLAVLLGDAADRGINFREVLARFGVTVPPRAANVTALADYRARQGPAES